MTQEATMIVLDNSNYMRNGDFVPNRFLAQRDALSFICGTKKRLNPENTLGLVTLSGCQILCTLTTDITKVYNKASQLIPDGETSFCTCIAIAHLALRNRQARNQKPKIFIFIGSPIEDTENELNKIARRLKKEKVTVTIINFGEVDYNEKKLSAFIEILNGKDCNTSQILSIPQGSGIQEFLRVNPSLLGETDGIVRNIDFGLEGIDDPDLEYALRLSLEEQRMAEAQHNTPKIVPLATEVPMSSDEIRLNQSVIDAALNLSNDVIPENNLQGMTEEEQISYAINMSLMENQQKDSNVEKNIKEKRKKNDNSKDNSNKNKNNKSKRKR